LIRVAFDLHRNAILRQMNIGLPESFDDERILWPALTDWIASYAPPYVRAQTFDPKDVPQWLRPPFPYRLSNGERPDLVIQGDVSFGRNSHFAARVRAGTKATDAGERGNIRLHLIFRFGLLAALAAIGTWQSYRRAAGGGVHALVPIAAHAIAQYTTLTSADVAGPRDAVARLAGSVTMTAIRDGEVILPWSVVKPQQPIAGRWLVSVPPLGGSAPIPGEVVTLLGIELKRGRVREVSHDAVVVDNGASASVVALPPEDAKMAAGYSPPNRTLTVVRRVPVLAGDRGEHVGASSGG
jgi:hypothetical protein